MSLWFAVQRENIIREKKHESALFDCVWLIVQTSMTTLTLSPIAEKVAIIPPVAEEVPDNMSVKKKCCRPLFGVYIHA